MSDEYSKTDWAEPLTLFPSCLWPSNSFVLRNVVYSALEYLQPPGASVPAILGLRPAKVESDLVKTNLEYDVKF
ncbi:hypothetical protein Ddc_22536 [Ditylenchus destructor]|nr:hypothetical protein Ddc_22536 [Ditylenchus destructor]